MIDRVLTQYKMSDHHTKEMVGGALVAVLLKCFAALAAFFFNAIIARMLGPDIAGIFFLSLTIITIAAVVGRLGLENTLVRFTASSVVTNDWVAIKGLARKGILSSLVMSGVSSVFVVLSAPWLADNLFSDLRLISIVRWMAIAIVPISLFTLYAKLLQGLKRVRDYISVLSVFQPFFAMIGLVVAIPFWGIKGAVWAYSCSSVVTLMIGYYLWYKATPQLVSLNGHFDTSVLVRSSTPLFLMALLQLVIQWSSTLMLGVWRSSAEVGIFAMANRTAMLTSFILTAINSIAAPKFSELNKLGDLPALGRTFRSSAKMATIIASPILVMLVVAPEWIMRLFGDQFVPGASALAIMAIGQFINVATGSVGFMVMMCGYEELMFKNLAFCAVINILLNITLIPPMGVMGASIAVAITVATQNLIALVLVERKIGITIMPKIRK